MPRRRANGAGHKTIADAVGGLRVPSTERLDLETLWIDMIVPNQANQLFRARLLDMKERGLDIKDAFSLTPEEVIDGDGKISTRIIDMIFSCFVSGWGAYDEKGKEVPLYDEDGEVSQCTLDEFSHTVREIEGGDAMFFAIQRAAIMKGAKKAEKAAEEKNSSGK